MRQPADPKQAALFQDSNFDPLPYKDRHYMPALQTKPGELDALSHVSLKDWNYVTPLIQVLGQKDPGGTYRTGTISGWAQKVASALKSRPCFLDTIRFKPGHDAVSDTGNRQSSAIAYLHEAMRRRGVPFVPVYSPVSSVQALDDAIHVSLSKDSRGMAIRFGFDVLPSGLDHSQFLLELTDRFSVDPSTVDLIVDFSYLDADRERPPGLISRVLNQITSIAPWRNVVTLATSMPSTLSCVAERSMGSIDRLEWALWESIATRATLHHVPTFGDYGIQNPKPPAEISGPGMRANVRYTTKGRTLIARGGSVMLEGNEQYRDLCAMIVDRKEFAGGHYSWGDRMIEDCASGAIPPKAQDMWRGAGTSHHLRHVTESLSATR